MAWKNRCQDNSRALFQKRYLTSSLNGTEDDRHYVEKRTVASQNRKINSEEWILKYEDSLGIPSPIYFAYIFIFMRTEEWDRFMIFLKTCFEKENRQPLTSETDLTFTARSQKSKLSRAHLKLRARSFCSPTEHNQSQRIPTSSLSNLFLICYTPNKLFVPETPTPCPCLPLSLCTSWNVLPQLSS